MSRAHPFSQDLVLRRQVLLLPVVSIAPHHGSLYHGPQVVRSTQAELQLEIERLHDAFNATEDCRKRTPCQVLASELP